MTIMHFVACAWHVVASDVHWERRKEEFFGEDDAKYRRVAYGAISPHWLYVMSLYESVLLLMGEDIDIVEDREMVFAIIVIIVCAVLLAIVFGQVGVLISNMNERPQAYRRKMAMLDDAMVENNLPKVLRDQPEPPTRDN